MTGPSVRRSGVRAGESQGPSAELAVRPEGSQSRRAREYRRGGDGSHGVMAHPPGASIGCEVTQPRTAPRAPVSRWSGWASGLALVALFALAVVGVFGSARASGVLLPGGLDGVLSLVEINAAGSQHLCPSGEESPSHLHQGHWCSYLELAAAEAESNDQKPEREQAIAMAFQLPSESLWSVVRASWFVSRSPVPTSWRATLGLPRGPPTLG